MKILHLAKFYFPENGGIENVVCTLSEGIQNYGHKVSIHCFSNIYETEEINNVEVNRSKHINIFNQPISLKYWLDALKKYKKFDIIHVHYPNFIAALIILLMFDKPKIIIHWHADYPKFNKIIDFFVNIIVTITLNRASSVIATSQQYADSSYLLRNHKSKTIIIPIGIDEITTKLDKKIQIRPEIVNIFKNKEVAHILGVGRLVKYKGFKNLILAALKLKPNIQINIVGKGPEMNNLRNLIFSLSIENKVKLIGKVSNCELDYMYKNSNIFCLPSINKQEAFGVVQLEAMKYKLPIISTEIEGSGVSWVNKDNISGLIVPINNPEIITDTIHRILDDFKLSKSLSYGAHNRLINNFTADIFIKNTLKLYQSLMKEINLNGN